MSVLAEMQYRARIYAAEHTSFMVGSVLGRYRMHAGLRPEELAAWLGIMLAALADLAHEARPNIVGIDGTVRPEHGIATLADRYRADGDHLMQIFNLGAGD